MGGFLQGKCLLMIKTGHLFCPLNFQTIQNSELKGRTTYPRQCSRDDNVWLHFKGRRLVVIAEKPSADERRRV